MHSTDFTSSRLSTAWTTYEQQHSQSEQIEQRRHPPISCLGKRKYAAIDQSAFTLTHDSSSEIPISKYLSIAHKAIIKTKRMNFLSPNYLNRSGIFLGKTDEAIDRYVDFALKANERLTFQRSLVNLNFSALPIQDDFQVSLTVALTAIVSRIGQCGEMCHVIFCYLLDKFGVETKIDILQFDGGNHCFIAVGRGMGSTLSDYRTWGPDAIVIDPWALTYFPASEMENLLKGCADRGAGGKPAELAFNPQKHSFSLRNTNIYSSEDLGADLGKLSDNDSAQIKLMQQWLANFLECNSQEERFLWADSLISNPLCMQIRFKHPAFYTPVEKKISNLFSQVSFYLFIWRDGNHFFPSKNKRGRSLSLFPLPTKNDRLLA